MPLYDYICGACGHLLEVIHGLDAEGPRFCPSCGAEGRMKKAFAPPAVVFKGSGWAKKDRSATARSGKAATPSEAKPDAAATSGDGKPAGSSDGGATKPAPAGGD